MNVGKNDDDGDGDDNDGGDDGDDDSGDSDSDDDGDDDSGDSDENGDDISTARVTAQSLGAAKKGNILLLINTKWSS